MNRFLIALILTCFFSCKPEKEIQNSLKTGIWRATLVLQGRQLPFNFDVIKDQQAGYDIYLRNASERILLDEVIIEDDTVDMTLHIFDASIRAAIDGDTLKGYYVRNYDPGFKFPFTAVYSQAFRFEKAKSQNDVPDFSGKYDVTFVNDTDTLQAVGIFKQEKDSVVGTFLTPEGDYRYLQGNVVNAEMQLSTFDGNHAFLFTAIKGPDGKLHGDYFSGKKFHQTWTGDKNENASLPDEEAITYLKKGFEKIEFTFPNPDGKPVSLNDQKYKNKVVILQLSGTWCPNCIDETKFLIPWYNENKKRGVEIIGLAYERKDDFNYASARVKKMIAKFNVPYDFVIAGTNDKAKALETLPQLNKIAAFPTTIFIGRDGKVKKIHTGFSGPGTGVYYEQFVEHFNETVSELLVENLTSEK